MRRMRRASSRVPHPARTSPGLCEGQGHSGGAPRPFPAGSAAAPSPFPSPFFPRSPVKSPGGRSCRKVPHTHTHHTYTPHTHPSPECPGGRRAATGRERAQQQSRTQASPAGGSIAAGPRRGAAPGAALSRAGPGRRRPPPPAASSPLSAAPPPPPPPPSPSAQPQRRWRPRSRLAAKQRHQEAAGV